MQHILEAIYRPSSNIAGSCTSAIFFYWVNNFIFYEPDYMHSS